MILRRWGAGAASQFWIGLISRRNVQESTASRYHVVASASTYAFQNDPPEELSGDRTP
jgi:hypothetical protein